MLHKRVLLPTDTRAALRYAHLSYDALSTRICNVPVKLQISAVMQSLLGFSRLFSGALFAPACSVLQKGLGFRV